MQINCFLVSEFRQRSPITSWSRSKKMEIRDATPDNNGTEVEGECGKAVSKDSIRAKRNRLEGKFSRRFVKSLVYILNTF